MDNDTFFLDLWDDHRTQWKAPQHLAQRCLQMDHAHSTMWLSRSPHIGSQSTGYSLGQNWHFIFVRNEALLRGRHCFVNKFATTWDTCIPSAHKESLLCFWYNLRRWLALRWEIQMQFSQQHSDRNGHFGNTPMWRPFSSSLTLYQIHRKSKHLNSKKYYLPTGDILFWRWQHDFLEGHTCM